MVWIVKYRKDLLSWPGVSESFCELIRGIGERYGWVIDTLATDGNHVHVFMGAPPRYAPAEVVKIMKSITAREIFQRFPQVKEELWGGEFWGDGYYVRTVGNEVTAEVIGEYIKKQGTKTEHKSYEQPKLF
jgi:putative transposase